ncbi:ABC transporter permease [Salinispirillum sp. LH 10-3-1]|uniref:ABC transporter permease n=1 Tax=Salinispirillum sp. LH 10-3-1 TaxID=2952525 RepID=A0AB38YIA4_9GAMM
MSRLIDWRALVADKGALLVLLAAPLLYAFFYPLPYQQEQLLQLPVVVVDQDHSTESRQFTRWLNATPSLSVVTIVADTPSAVRAVAEGDAMAWVTLPSGFATALQRGETANVGVATQGTMVLTSSRIMRDLNDVAAAYGAAVKRAPDGHSSMASAPPVVMQAIPMYNPSEGYGSYVVPGVLVMLIQQSLWMGLALFAGWQRQQSQSLWHQRRGRYGLWLVGTGVAVLTTAFSFGFVMRYQGYPQQAQWLSLCLFGVLFAASCAASGLALARCFRTREQGMQWLLASAIPFFFFSGYPIPVENLPPVLQALRWAVPSTAGIDGFMTLNAIGGGLAEVRTSMGVLATILALSLLVLGWQGRGDAKSTA